MATASDIERLSILRKACENCRIRKVRCNRADPCSNCQISGIVCRPAPRAPQQRPRLPVSNNVEKQLESIHDRLVGIEEALKGLPLQDPEEPNAGPFAISPGPASSQTAGSSSSSVTTPAHFEGESSFSRQTLRASQAQELTSAGASKVSEVTEALGSLRKLIGGHSSPESNNDVRFRAGSRSTGPSQIPLLPASLVLKLLRKAKAEIPMFYLAYGIRGNSELEKLCQKVYFSTECPSLGEITAMHGLLLFLLEEYSWTKEETLADVDCRAMMDICENNLHNGVETYELLATPTYFNVLALTLAATKAQEEYKSLLCWTLISAAARHCQALGYHRESTLKRHSAEDAVTQRHLFWTIYTFDKNMALTLGRTPILQEYDIDVQLLPISSDPRIAPWDEVFLAIIHLSRLQGEIYDKLYSSSALSVDTETRAGRIAELSSSFTQWYAKWNQLGKEHPTALYPEFLQQAYGPTELIYYSVLTSLHRAASISDSATEITAPCFEAARRCLEAHLGWYPQFAQGDAFMLSGYVAWTLLYTSFTPFVVIFLHAIATSSLSDIQLLQEVVKSLEHIKTAVKQCERLYEVCKQFCRLAQVFVESQKSFSQGKYRAQDDSLVLIPQQQPQPPQQPQHPQPSPNQGQQHGHLFASDPTSLGQQQQLQQHQQTSLPYNNNATTATTTTVNTNTATLSFPDIFEGQDLSNDFTSADLADMSSFFGSWLQATNQTAMDYIFQQ